MVSLMNLVLLDKGTTSFNEQFKEEDLFLRTFNLCLHFQLVSGGLGIILWTLNSRFGSFLTQLSITETNLHTIYISRLGPVSYGIYSCNKYNGKVHVNVSNGTL